MHLSPKSNQRERGGLSGQVAADLLQETNNQIPRFAGTINAAWRELLLFDSFFDCKHQGRAVGQIEAQAVRRVVGMAWREG